MNIILDMDAVKAPLTGVGTYALELGMALSAESGLSRLLFARGGRLLQALPAPGNANSPSWRGGMVAWLRKMPFAVDALLAHRRFRLARALRSRDRHIYHGTNYHLPLPGNPGRATGAAAAAAAATPRAEVAQVVMVHDVSVLRLPDMHPPDRVRVMRKALDRLRRQAQAILTPSEFTRREVIECLGIDAARVHATPLAASCRYHRRAAAETEPVLSAFQLEHGQYALITGTVEPRKNIGIALDAWLRLPEGWRRRWPLVIAGDSGWRNQALRRRMRQCARDGWLRYLGYVPGEVLPSLLAGAGLLLMPSLYEGFGLPVLEAMRSGVPVLHSGRASLPEVAGDAGMAVDPHDADAWGEAARRGLEDDAWRREAAQKGLARAEMFSWERCARETIAVYRAVEASCWGNL